MTRPKRLLTATAAWLAALMAVAHAAPEQGAGPDSAESAMIEGIVTSQHGPLAGVVVTLAGAGLIPPRAAVTDGDGAFAFADLPPGDFGLSIRKSPYVLSTVGGVLWMGDEVPIAVAAGRHVVLSVAMTRGGAIEGVVRDPFGQPIAGATVAVFRRRRDSTSAPAPPVATVSTDTQGRYRAHGLRSAEYHVQASARTASGSLGVELVDDLEYRNVERATRESRQLDLPPRPDREAVQYVPTYFGGTSFEENAVAVLVDSGYDRAGIDIQLGLGQSVTLRGLVTSSDGRPARASRVSLLPDQPGISLNASTVIAVDETGQFVKEGVGPGRYRIVARAPGPIDGHGIEQASVDLQVPGSQTHDIRMVLTRPRSLKGRLILDDLDSVDSEAHAQTVSSARVTLRRAGGGVLISSVDFAEAVVAVSGSFAIENVLPGDYVLTLTFPAAPGVERPGLEFIRIGSTRLPDGIVPVTESSDEPVEVHLSTRQAELSGTVTGQSTDLAGSLSVLVFPTELVWRRSSDRVRIVQVQDTGTYRVGGLPAGAYLVAVVSGVDVSGVFDIATFEEAAAMATPVEVSRGENRTLDLQVDRAP